VPAVAAPILCDQNYEKVGACLCLKEQVKKFQTNEKINSGVKQVQVGSVKPFLERKAVKLEKRIGKEENENQLKGDDQGKMGKVVKYDAGDPQHQHLSVTQFVTIAIMNVNE
jgi:hypothetical protein